MEMGGAGLQAGSKGHELLGSSTLQPTGLLPALCEDLGAGLEVGKEGRGGGHGYRGCDDADAEEAPRPRALPAHWGSSPARGPVHPPGTAAATAAAAATADGDDNYGNDAAGGRAVPDVMAVGDHSVLGSSSLSQDQGGKTSLRHEGRAAAEDCVQKTSDNRESGTAEGDAHTAATAEAAAAAAAGVGGGVGGGHVDKAWSAQGGAGIIEGSESVRVQGSTSAAATTQESGGGEGDEGLRGHEFERAAYFGGNALMQELQSVDGGINAQSVKGGEEEGVHSIGWGDGVGSFVGMSAGHEKGGKIEGSGDGAQRRGGGGEGVLVQQQGSEGGGAGEEGGQQLVMEQKGTKDAGANLLNRTGRGVMYLLWVRLFC